MTIHGLDYWYDGQIRRFLEQVVRAFSGFQYMTGGGANGPQLMMVPCRFANSNLMVAKIMRNQSSNTIISAPMITVWQTELTGRREDVQNPGFVDTLRIAERLFDPTTQTYGPGPGNKYTLERVMPRPFMLMLQIDIWTSNLDQKHQLMEQILPIIYPTFDIQNSDNALDWSALAMMMVDEINWTSRTMPVGTDSSLDIATINLRLPMWLSLPSKLTAQRVIQQIITNVTDGTATSDGLNTIISGREAFQVITTPGEYHIEVSGGTITLLAAGGDSHEDDGSLPNWFDLLNRYGIVQPAISQIRLVTGPDIEGPAIVGSIQYDSNGVNLLSWQVDPTTLPSNTLAAVNAIIDPMKTTPLAGLPSVAEGARYLLVGDVGPCTAWGNLSARANDIVQYSNGAWVVSFASVGTSIVQYVLNQFTGSQLRWTGTEWVMAIDGVYQPGYWRIAL